MPITDELIVGLAAKLDATPHGGRGPVVQETAKLWGVSQGTLYRHLQRVRPSGRATRSDKGKRSLQRDAVRLAAELMVRTQTKRGKLVTRIDEALGTLQEVGIAAQDCSPSTLARYLREDRISPWFLKAPSAAIQRVSNHPNHVHVVDASICLTWYLRKDGRVVQVPDEERVFYKNKPENFLKSKRKLYRYVLTDHCTHAFYVHYYYSTGETAEDLLDFLWRAWTPKDCGYYPLHGVPIILAGDQGPGLKAQTNRNLLKTLDVTPDLHMAGNARASGSVEGAHYHWEQWFESKLLLCPPSDLDELNERAFQEAAKINATKPMSRHKMSRSAAWSAWATDEHIRFCPDQDVFFHLAVRDAETRKVNNYGRISVAMPNVGKTWFELRGPVVPGETVEVRIHPYVQRQVRVWNSQDVELEVIRLEKGEHKFLEGGRSGGFAGEEYDRHRMQDAERIRRAAKEEPLELPAAAVFRKPAEDVENLAFLGAPRGGRPALREQAAQTAVTYMRIDVKAQAIQKLNRSLTREESRLINEHTPGPITAEEMEALIEKLSAEKVQTA